MEGRGTMRETETKHEETRRVRRRGREKMAEARGVITRRQFARYLAERRRFLRQRPAARRRRRRAGRHARHRHAPPSLAGPAVAVHRVKLQGPLERGARHGATAVGGGAAFSVLPCVSRARLTPSQRGPRSPGGEGWGTGPTSATGDRREGGEEGEGRQERGDRCQRRRDERGRFLHKGSRFSPGARSTRATATNS